MITWKAVAGLKVTKNAFYPVTALHATLALSFVIPSEAEGSAVQRTFRGNVFRQSFSSRLFMDSKDLVSRNRLQSLHHATRP